MLLISLFTMVLEFPTSFMFLCKIGQERIQKYTESRLRYWVHCVWKQGNKAISVQRQNDNLFRKSRDLPGGAEVRRPHSQRRGPGFPPWSENETPPATIKGLHLQGRSKALSAAVRPSVCVQLQMDPELLCNSGLMETRAGLEKRARGGLGLKHV